MDEKVCLLLYGRKLLLTSARWHDSGCRHLR